ncbi:MAG: hypothetical protein OHK0013_19810 [Sandaracinaceae bacterium]
MMNCVLERFLVCPIGLVAGVWLPLAGAGCVATDPTEMVVLVDTDLPIASQDGSAVLPGEIRSIRFEIACLAEMGDPPCRLRGRDETTFNGFEQSYVEANLGTRPPFYFVLRRDAPGLRRTFRVTATAFVGPDLEDDTMEERVVSIASASTVEGEARVMVVGLRQECLNVECASGYTCALGGGCAPPTTPANVWTGACETVARPGFPSRACEDDLFAP